MTQDNPLRAPAFALPRRALLASGAVVAGVALASGLFLTRRFREPDGLQNATIDLVRRLFGKDIAAEAELRAFADFYLSSRNPQRNFIRAYAAAPAAFDIARFTNVAGLNDRVWSLKYELTEAFLRNTNMLYREPGEPVIFAQQAPMGVGSCINPMARFDYDD